MGAEFYEMIFFIFMDRSMIFFINVVNYILTCY